MGDPELWESCTLLGSPRPRSAGSHCPPSSLGGRQAPTPQASLLVNTATRGSKGLQSPSSSPSKEGKMQARRQCEGERPQYGWAPSGSQVQTCPAVPCPLGPARQLPSATHLTSSCRELPLKGKMQLPNLLQRKNIYIRKRLILYKIICAHKDSRGSGTSVSESILQHQAASPVPRVLRRGAEVCRPVQSPGEPRTLSLKCASAAVGTASQSCRRCVQSHHIFKHVQSYF